MAVERGSRLYAHATKNFRRLFRKFLAQGLEQTRKEGAESESVEALEALRLGMAQSLGLSEAEWAEAKKV